MLFRLPILVFDNELIPDIEQRLPREFRAPENQIRRRRPSQQSREHHRVSPIA